MRVIAIGLICVATLSLAGRGMQAAENGSIGATALAHCPAVPAYPYAKIPGANRAHNDIPPRLQWNANDGYCGETSFVSAGLYYGQYVSQYAARALASPGVPQDERRSQLLLGNNDRAAARRMHLDVVPFYTQEHSDPDVFLAWIKQNVVRGYPVAIGVYTNESIFPDGKPGDPQYDHIVPVVGVDSLHDLTDPGYYPDDVIVFSDNGLYTPRAPDRFPFYFSYRSDRFLKSRQQANAVNGAPYGLARIAGNYGVAFTGVTDRKHETVPVRVSLKASCELPRMKNGATQPPDGRLLELTVRVSDLQPGTDYVLYQYKYVRDVPDEDFNSPINAAKAQHRWVIHADPGTTQFTMTRSVRSDHMAIFRAVAQTAP